MVKDRRCLSFQLVAAQLASSVSRLYQPRQPKNAAGLRKRCHYALWCFISLFFLFPKLAYSIELSVPASSSTGIYTITWPGMATTLGGGVYIEALNPSTNVWMELYSGDIGVPKSLNINNPNGSYSYRTRQCIAWASAQGGGANCSVSPAKTIVVSIPAAGLAPSQVSVSTPALKCNEDALKVSWSALTWAEYGLEVVDRAPGGSWPTTWRRIASNIGALYYDVSGLAPGRQFKFRVSARAPGSGDSYTNWRESALVTKDSCPVAVSETPFVANASALVSGSEIQETDRVGATGGEFKVNESGAATYSIGIQTVAGTAGVAPQFSFGYSSQGGNGLMGKGWGLSGQSAISRCRQTLLQDRQALPISWGSSDRFCLNGQRLLLVSGTYGAPGSTYKTEIDSQVKVTAQGGSAGKPDYFTMEAKDGSKTWFGHSGNHSSEVVGYNEEGYAQVDKILSWNINRFEDSVGNPIVYIYEGDETDHHLIRVEYGFGSSSSAAASLAFDYEERPDPQTSYVAGVRFQTHSRLSEVRSLQSSALVRRYALEYQPSVLSSVLSSVEECIATSCLPKVEFSWDSLSNPSNGVSVKLSSGQTMLTHSVGDLNGDGLQDLAWIEKGSNGRNIFYKFFGEDQKFSAGQVSSDNVRLAIFDYNLDGRGDLAIWDSSQASGRKWRSLLSTPQLIGGQVQWRLDSLARYLPFDHKNTAFMDLNSDGITDAYFLTENSRALKVYHGRRRSGVAASDPRPYEFSPSIQVTDIPGTGDLSEDLYSWGDFNGDGLTDLVVRSWGAGCSGDGICSDRRLDVMMAQMDGSFEYHTNFYAGSYRPKGVQVADLNGDGLSDVIFRIENGVWQYRISTGVDFLAAQTLHHSSYGSETVNEDEVGLADINQDGYADFYWKHNRYAIQYKTWLPTENHFSKTLSISVSVADDTSVDLTDMNGDGVYDIVKTLYKAQSGGTLGVTVTPGKTNGVSFVNKITTGLGMETSIDYSPLSDLNHADYYQTYGGINVFRSIREVCTGYSPPDGSAVVGRECSDQPVSDLDASEFYSSVNDPFSYLPSDLKKIQSHNVAPVFEVKGAVPVVTKVSSHSPMAADPNFQQSVDYRYGLNLMQAAGRGSLGFRHLTTVDNQTGVTTTTTYRQDWPFIGQPLKTIVRSLDGAVLSEAVSSSTVYGYASSQSSTLASAGSAALGPLQVYTDKTVEIGYDLVDNGAVQGDWVKRVTTNMSMDAYGNATSVSVKTEDADGAWASTLTTSSFGSDTWSKEKGRLKDSVVTHQRLAPGASTVSLSSLRTEFAYYTSGVNKGLLFVEYNNKPSASAAAESETRHFYDAYGNPAFTSTVGRDGVARISGLTLYDARGRYPTKTLALFDGLVGGDDAGAPAAYQAERQSLGLAQNTSLQVVSSVGSRDLYGHPKIAYSYIGASKYVTSKAEFTPFGNAYFSTDSAGGYSLKTAELGAGYHCPSLTVYSSRERAAGGAEGVTCFDLLGREIRVGKLMANGAWSYVDTEYDAMGRVARKSEPASGQPSLWTEFEYDLLGRMIKTQRPDASQLTVVFSGNVTTTVNDAGLKKIEVRSGTGQLVAVTDDEGGTIQYGYRADGQLETLTNPAGNVTHLAYDLMGRKTSMQDPDKGHWSYEYNDLGELMCQKDAEGNVISNIYDFAGRLVERIDRTAGGTCAAPTGTITGHAYWQYDTAPNGLGKLSDEQDDISQFQKVYVYDGLGRASITRTYLPGHNNLATAHSEKVVYDQFSRPWKTYDAARKGDDFNSNGVVNVYNQYGYLQKVVNANDANYVYYEVLTVDARGNATSEALGNGVLDRRTDYDEQNGQLLQLTAYDVSGHRIQDMEMQWDSIGNLEYREDRGYTRAGNYRNLREGFQYDDLNRLTDYAVSGTVSHDTRVQYNALGNIIYKSDVGTYTYNVGTAAVRPHAVSKAGSYLYNYNKNGSLTSDGRGRTFAYTAFDKVAKVTKSGRATEFYYDTGRSRFKRVDTNTSSGKKTTTLYLGSVEKLVHEDNTQEWRRTVGGVALITQLFNTAGSLSSTKTQYLLKDHLGSINVIADQNGIIKEEMAFDPWGKRRTTSDWRAMPLATVQANWFVSSKPETNRGFTGHEMVDEMEIIHMNGRIYDPLLGRFLQADPVIQDPTQTASLNRYSYCWNNPLNATDPSGYSLTKMFRNAIKGASKIFGAEVVNFFGTMLFAWIGGIDGVAFWTYQFSRAMGASSGDAFRAAATSAVVAAASAGIGNTYGEASYMSADHLKKMALHGLVGGVAAEVNGGKFGHGFVSSAITEFASPVSAGINGVMKGSVGVGSAGWVTRITMAAIVGGTVSELTGGKFKNGAQTAALQRMFNAEAHMGGGDDAQKEEGPVLLKNVKVYRLEPYSGDGKFGHYWVEVDGKGFGWYPKKQTGILGWLAGVEGKFYDGNDIKTGERWDVDVYDVYVDSKATAALQTNSYVIDSIRNIAATYSEYGRGADCHTFQYDIIEKLGWALERKVK